MAKKQGRVYPRPLFIGAHWSTILILAITAICSIGCIVALFFPQTNRGAFDNRTLISICALSFAVFSFFIRSLQSELQSRKQHTIKVLFDTRLSSEFRGMLECRRDHFPIKTVIDPQKYASYLDAKRSETLSEEDASHRRRSAEALRSLLNYYEFVAFGVEMRDLDKTLLKGTIRSIMCNLVQDARYVISASQADSTTHYEHLAKLYEEWREDRFEPIPSAGTPLPDTTPEPSA